MPTNNIVHVAVAVIQDSHGQYLIAKRPQESHQGGLWEFPGGKVENNETVLDALKRELFEEIGITLIQATPLIKIHHDYSNKSVLLDVWRIDGFSGTVFGKEGQETCWINENEFSLYDFPAANSPIIKAILLPDKYMITGEFTNEEELLLRIHAGLNKGIKLIQFRAHHLSEENYFHYAKKIHELCEIKNTTLLLNTSIKNYKKYKANKYSHGLHLTSKEIAFFSSRLLDDKLLISASVHNQAELLMAESKNIDFIVLSPVNKTLSHPDATPLGWENFEKLTERSRTPIYALGGMKKEDIEISKVNGGQGIAAIGAFWSA